MLLQPYLYSCCGGHRLPPCAAARMSGRLRCCALGPHVALHADQADQTPREQSTGHGWVAQLRDSASIGQAAPPLLALRVT